MRWSEILSSFQLSAFRFSPIALTFLSFSGYISTPLQTIKSLKGDACLTLLLVFLLPQG